MLRRSPLVLMFALAFTLIGPAMGARAAMPGSMAAVGDSITRAYNTGSSAYADYPPNSWSTGSSTTVKSHAVRLAVPAASAFNDAVSGAKMADLNAQVTNVNAQHVEYVTILMGGNDVCTSSESTMTSVANYASQFRTAMTTLTQGSPGALIYVLSVPDVYNLWSVLKNNGSARFFWSIFKICQSMLANPLSTAAADATRRANVRQRNVDFNAELKTICAEFATCRFDGGVTFSTKFVAADVSTRDYFHPSVAGQTKLAAASWSAGYWGP